MVLRIARQFPLHEVVQQPKCFAGTSSKRIHWTNRAIKVLPALGYVCRCLVVPKPKSRRLLPLDLRLWITGQRQELLQPRLQTRTNDARRVLLLLQQFRRNDHVGIDRPERNSQFLCRALAPHARLAQWILITDYQRCIHFVAKIQQRMVGVAAKREANTSLVRALLDIRYSLRKKREVPQVRMRIERHRCKENDDRLIQRIRSFDRNVERGIIERALCPLHPVHDAAIAAGGRTRPSHGDTRIRGECLELCHGVMSVAEDRNIICPPPILHPPRRRHPPPTPRRALAQCAPHAECWLPSRRLNHTAGLQQPRLRLRGACRLSCR